jgi:hypothetical protein
MDANFLADVQNDWKEAYFAEKRADYVEALRLYRLVAGAGAMISATEKDGLRIEFGKLSEKIAELEALANRASGAGKVRRVPIVNQRTTSPPNYPDDWSGYGYPWG